jgi:hypothetical protein
LRHFRVAEFDELGTPAFDSLELTLESPSGVFTSPTGNSSELDALYRRISIVWPEPGVWTMHLGEGVTVLDLVVECMNCTAEDLDPGDLVYELRFNVDVAPNAPLTQRDLVVEIGTADYVKIGATTVVTGDIGGTDSINTPP